MALKKDLNLGLERLSVSGRGPKKNCKNWLGSTDYILIDRAFKSLPALLKKDYGLIVKEKLKRKFVTDNKGQPVEVNIIGQTDQNGQTSVIVGEAKSQLSKNDKADSGSRI